MTKQHISQTSTQKKYINEIMYDMTDFENGSNATCKTRQPPTVIHMGGYRKGVGGGRSWFFPELNIFTP